MQKSRNRKRRGHFKKAKWLLALLMVLILSAMIVPEAWPLNSEIIPSDLSFKPIEEEMTTDTEREAVVFSPCEVLAPADSLAHAQKIAGIYGLELKSFAYGIAVLMADDPEAVVALSSRTKQDGMPELSLNQRYQTYETDVSGVGTVLDAGLLWYHQEMDTERAWSLATGEDILVAVIDTGIEINHPAFAGRLSDESYNSYTDSIGLEQVQDDLGHGTHVSGILAAALSDAGDAMVCGVAPDAELLVIKSNIPDDPNYFDQLALLRGINYAVEKGADIINLSLGRDYFYGEDELEHNVIADAVASGVTVVCAAGNESNRHASYPAAYPETIAVSATRQSYLFDSVYSGSNYGPEIDVSAPGGLIYSTAKGGGFTTKSGTSMASPNVAGVAALIKELNPEYTPEQVRALLRGTAQHAGDLTNRNDRFGYGIVSAYAAVLGSDGLYDVTYDFNDGTGREAFVVKVAPGGRLVKPAPPQKQGQVFDMWLVEETGAIFDFTESVEDDLALYAQWVEAVTGMYAAEFPDINFRGAVLDMLNSLDGGDRTDITIMAGSDKIELAAVERLDVEDLDISDLTGLKYFTGLDTLYCTNNNLTALDVSGNPQLGFLACANNQLISLTASNNLLLEEISCYENQLAALDISNLPRLNNLDCSENQLAALDVSNNPVMRALDCSGNQLTSLDVSNCPELWTLRCSANELVSLNLAGCSSLIYLGCDGNQLTTLTVSDCPALEYLDCSRNQITALGVASNGNIIFLICTDNKLTSLDVSKIPQLFYLDCSENYMLTTDDVGGWQQIGLVLDNSFFFHPQKDTSGMTIRVTSDIFTVNQPGNVIRAIPEMTTAAHFLNSLNEQGSHIVLKKNGVALAPDSVVGTGTQLVILDGSAVVRTYTLVITGDLDGDGAVTVNDLMLITSHILEKNRLGGAFAQAALVDTDHQITVNDLMLITSHILGKQKIVAR